MKRHNAFTLIELLVVIAIIAILAAILFPVFAQAREQARKTACLSNLKQVGLGVGMYIQDYDEKFPRAWGSCATTWHIAIEPYVKTGMDRGEDTWSRRGGAFWHCPSDGKGNNVSYTGNALLLGVDNCPGGWFNEEAATLAAVRRPANVIFAGDGNKVWFSWVCGWWEPPTDWIRPSLDLGVANTSEEARLFYEWWARNADYTDGPAIHPWEFDGGECNSAGVPVCATAWGNKSPSWHHNRTGYKTGSANFVYADGHAKAHRFGSLTAANFLPHLEQ